MSTWTKEPLRTLTERRQAHVASLHETSLQQWASDEDQVDTYSWEINGVPSLFDALFSRAEDHFRELSPEMLFSVFLVWTTHSDELHDELPNPRLALSMLYEAAKSGYEPAQECFASVLEYSEVEYQIADKDIELFTQHAARGYGPGAA